MSVIHPEEKPPAAPKEENGGQFLRWRYFVMGLTVTVFACLIWISHPVYKVYQDVEDNKLSLEDLPFNDVTKTAVDVRIDQSKSLFSYNILLLGVLWGFVLLNKEGPGISFKDTPELVTFFLANVGVIANAIYYSIYMKQVSRLVVSGARQSGSGKASIPNLFDERISTFSDVQLWGLACVLVMVALLVISVHKLKGHTL